MMRRKSEVASQIADSFDLAFLANQKDSLIEEQRPHYYLETLLKAEMTVLELDLADDNEAHRIEYPADAYFMLKLMSDNKSF